MTTSEDSTLAITILEATDVGQLRDENQDHVAHRQWQGLSLCVVCDGMGGHLGGRRASRLAMESLFTAFEESGEDDLRARLCVAVEAANHAVWEVANSDPEVAGMGTTCVALLVDQREAVAHIAHVGDSRCYLSRGDELRLLTRDHTVVQRMLDDGLLTRDQAEHHPHSNVIARSLGGERTVDVELNAAPLPIEEGDLFLLCSDGLTGMVTELAVARLLWIGGLEESAARLIDAANDSGGTDNITVQLVQAGERAEPPEHFRLLHPTRRPSAELRGLLLQDNETRPARIVPELEASECDEALDEPPAPAPPQRLRRPRDPNLPRLPRAPAPAAVWLGLGGVFTLALAIVLWVAQ